MEKRKRRMDLSKMRKEYKKAKLDLAHTHVHPMRQFEEWMQQAFAAGIEEANAMCLATATPDGKPSARMVLLKYFDEHGLVFFTNYESRKAQELQANPHAALLFYWKELERQVRIEGVVEKVSRTESVRYFMSRPRGSRIAAWISPQSKIIESREVLLRWWEEFRRKGTEALQAPAFWGGYRVRPQRVEFWQGRESRLHDRILYVLEQGQWKRYRLAP